MARRAIHGKVMLSRDDERRLRLFEILGEAPALRQEAVLQGEKYGEGRNQTEGLISGTFAELRSVGSEMRKVSTG
ncbi:hypothetical protein NL676_017947 [Syzygium grande]|nr:hypothetical protein NL676_017947 [Syzygium grande]